MNKKILICFLCIGIFSLTGCGVNSLYYKGEFRPTSQVEEMIEDTLEADNPDYDLDVNIGLDTED